MHNILTVEPEAFEFDGTSGAEAEFEDNFSAEVADQGTDGRIIDLTAKADRGKRSGTRDPKKVHALVLHQMACCFQRKDPLNNYLKTGAHFAILSDGRILQLHPVSAMIWASNCLSPRSVAVEFAGNFPSTSGRWWFDCEKDPRTGDYKAKGNATCCEYLRTHKRDQKGCDYLQSQRNQVTAAQIEAGRYLVRYLIRTMGLKTIVAHRQSSATRENDPGPDIWYHVGQWAVDNLGLNDGGPGFKCGSGNSIPDAWRTWGHGKPEREYGPGTRDEFEADWLAGPRAEFNVLGFEPEGFEFEAGKADDILAGGAFSGLTRSEQKALAITSTLETGQRGGFNGLSGNFDGMGISFGLVNWNIGSGSLQPLLRDFAREFPRRWSTAFGPDADRFLSLILPRQDAARKSQLEFAKLEMNVLRNGKWQVKQPWVTYFRRLAEDAEFQRIQVRYARILLNRANYFCDYFAFRTERAFCFMFDAVASHGMWWLTKKNSASVQVRRQLLRAKLASLNARLGAANVSERHKLEAIAETLRDTSLGKWAERVYARKMWFLTGQHLRQRELAGLEPTDIPYSISSGSATPPQPSKTR
jgi:hypothetical protein